MLRIINIKGRTGRFDIPSFPLTDNEELTVKFNISENRFGRYIVIVQHGKLEKKFMLNPKEMTVTLTPDWIKDGGLEPIYFLLEFRNASADKVVISNDPKKAGFFIEPLYITRVEGNTTAQAWLTKIESAIAELQKIVQAQGETLAEIPQKIAEAEREAVIEATGGDPMNG